MVLALRMILRSESDGSLKWLLSTLGVMLLAIPKCESAVSRTAGPVVGFDGAGCTTSSNGEKLGQKAQEMARIELLGTCCTSIVRQATAHAAAVTRKAQLSRSYTFPFGANDGVHEQTEK